MSMGLGDVRYAGTLAEVAQLVEERILFPPISDMSWRRRTGISEDRVVPSLMAALPTVRSYLTTIYLPHFSSSRQADRIGSTQRSATALTGDW